MKRSASSARRGFELGARPGERDWIRLILSCGVFMRGVGHERRSEDTGSVSRESWRPAVGASRDSGIRQRIGRPRQERLSARAAQAWRWVPNQGRCQTHVAEQLPCEEQTPYSTPHAVLPSRTVEGREPLHGATCESQAALLARESCSGKSTVCQLISLATRDHTCHDDVRKSQGAGLTDTLHVVLTLK